MSVFLSLNTIHFIKKTKKCFENHLHAPKQDRLNGKQWDEIGTSSDHRWKTQELNLNAKMKSSILENRK